MSEPSPLKISIPTANNENAFAGITFMVTGIMVLTVMDALAKILVEADYSPFQILAIRGWVISFCLVGWMGFRGKLGDLKTRRGGHYAIRGIIGFFAPFLFFTALGDMPLADAVVIFFAAPFIMTALSIPLLKETVGRHRWTAICFGFIGVIVVLQPGSGTFQTASFYVLGSCLAYSLVQLMTRWMSRTEPAIRIVFYFNLATAIIGTCALPFIWKPMPVEHVLLLLLMTGVAMAGHILMTTAFSRAPISIIAPFEYTGLIWSALLGFLIWGDFPASHVWLGAGIIVISGIYMVHRERLNAQKAKNHLLSDTDL